MTGSQPEETGLRTVRLRDLLAGGGGVPDSSIKDSTYLQRAGVRLFKWVLWLFAGSLVLLAIYVGWATPGIPDLSTSGSATDSVVVRLLVEDRRSVFEQAIRLAGLFFANIYFPLLTGILGYIFGSQNAVETQSE